MHMKKLILSLMVMFPLVGLLAQDNNSPQRVTDEIAKKINKEIEADVVNIKAIHKGKNILKEELEFIIDTFRIERFVARSIDYDYSTTGMNIAGYTATLKYDSLLNKYYKLLLGKLDPDDKNILIEAQRAWIIYRDKALSLIGMLRKEKYSGGGTIQTNIYSAKHTELIKERVLTLFDYYLAILTEGIKD